MNRKKINIVITILTVTFIFISSLACTEAIFSKNPKLTQLTSFVAEALWAPAVEQYYSKWNEEREFWINGRKVSEDEFERAVEVWNADYEDELSFKLKEDGYNNFPDASFVGASEVYTISAEGKIEDKIFSLSDIQDIKNSSGEQTSQNASPGEDTIKSDTENIPKGSITLTGNIGAPSIYTVSQLTLTINFDTGEITTGSFTGSYYYPGEVIDLGALGKIVYEPDTANGIANFGGNVNLKTGKITGAGAVVYTWASGGEGETWPFSVEGDLSTKDYKSAIGKFIFSEQGEWTWEASD